MLVLAQPGMIDLVFGNFQRSGSKVVGELAFHVDANTWFPDPRWSDFVVVIAGWWLDALAVLAEQGQTTLSFMDGPCEVRARRDPGGQVELEFVRAGRQVASSRTSWPRLSERVEDFARALLEFCDEAGVADGDVDRLRSRLASFFVGRASEGHLDSAGAELVSD